MVRHYFGLSGDINWGKVRNLQSLGFYPSERLKVFQEEVILGEL
jgi:hypothetical protein